MSDPVEDVLREKIETRDQRIITLDQRIADLEQQLARLQRWPDLDWAQVTASICSRLASLARNGEQTAAKDMLDVLDKGEIYVDRILAERDAAMDKIRVLREALDKIIDLTDALDVPAEVHEAWAVAQHALADTMPFGENT